MTGSERLMSHRFTAILALAGVGLASCALQAPYQRPDLALAPRWANATADMMLPSYAQVPDPLWWAQLSDPAVDALTEAALIDNPTLAQAAALVDEARASLRVARAQQIPQLGAEGTAALAHTAGAPSPTGTSVLTESSAALGSSLSWELDLWGRLRQSALAANERLDARTADATELRLALIAELADGVEDLRACDFSLTVRDTDIASRETELALTRMRLEAGNAAPVEAAVAEANLANARTERIRQAERCSRDADTLVELSGRDAATVRRLVAAPVPSNEAGPAAGMPIPPPARLALPATVLLNHPAVVSAEREAQARWSEIAVARAERLPRLDLFAVLAGNWLRAFGEATSFDAWSAGANLSAPVLDGGGGAAKVRRAEARYREAVARLSSVARESAREIEDALAAQQSAGERVETSRQAVEAARVALAANDARWRAGAISRFELEDSRRQFNLAQESTIAALRDRAEAWIDLIRASGAGAPVATPSARKATQGQKTERAP